MVRLDKNVKQWMTLCVFNKNLLSCLPKDFLCAHVYICVRVTEQNT